MDIVKKDTGERQRVIGIYWSSEESHAAKFPLPRHTYVVGFSPSRRTYEIFIDGTGEFEVVDAVINERFTFSPYTLPSLINSVIVEEELWDGLMEYDRAAHDRLLELMPELLDVGLEYLYCCRVCGYRLPFYTWGRDNKSPTYELCPCCGVQFGVMDETPLLASKERQEWQGKGMPWFQEDKKPDNWQPEGQLAQIPPGFIW